MLRRFVPGINREYKMQIIAIKSTTVVKIRILDVFLLLVLNNINSGNIMGILAIEITPNR